MRSLLFLTSVLFCLVVIGCHPAAAPPEPEIDLEAARTSLIAADEAWFEAYSTTDNPADAFVDRVTGDAYLLPPDAPRTQGKEAIHAVIAELEAMPGFDITWSPSTADVGSGGDLGYTLGSYEMTMEGPEGPIRIDGKYLTVWRKQADGSWKVTADMFNADGPPVPVEE